MVIYGIKNNFSIEFSKCNRKKQAKSGFFLRFCIARNNNNFIYNENNIYAHTVVLIEHKDFDHAPKRQFYIIFRRLYIPIPHVLCMMMTSIVIRYNSMFNIFCSFSVCLNIIFFLFFCLLTFHLFGTFLNFYVTNNTQNTRKNSCSICIYLLFSIAKREKKTQPIR